MPSTKPGQRKLQILQALAAMLEQPKGEKITTAALAARLDVSEAALYRHFASKAQMFEGLIEFIESSVFGLINQIAEREAGGVDQAHAILQMLLGFAANNPGMTRVLIGDALVNEDDRLQLRMNQFYDKVELACKQSLRSAAGTATPRAASGRILPKAPPCSSRCCSPLECCLYRHESRRMLCPARRCERHRPGARPFAPVHRACGHAALRRRGGVAADARRDAGGAGARPVRGIAADV
jgi:TetR/AcrR family transcriptional regulator